MPVAVHLQLLRNKFQNSVLDWVRVGVRVKKMLRIGFCALGVDLIPEVLVTELALAARAS